MATLKSLVDETNNIKNELKTCHTTLKNNLIAKGVECSEDDKMSSLVDKVNGLIVIKEPVSPGDNFFVVYDKNEYYASDQPVFVSPAIKLKGSYRVLFDCGSQSGYRLTYRVQHVRGTAVIKQQDYSHTLEGMTTKTYDFTNVVKGDIFKFYVIGNHMGSYLKMTRIGISFACEL